MGKENGLPVWLQIFPYGWVETTKYEPALCDEEAQRLIVAEFKDHGVDLVFDYEHQTTSGQKAPAAGWVKELEAGGKDGLFGRVEWTAKAGEYILNKEYRYFSPAMMVRASDRRIVAVYSIALTNFPAMKKQKPLIAKACKGGCEIMQDGLSETQLKVNRQLGISPETFAKYGPQPMTAKADTAVVQVQINKMLGISAETWNKYGPGRK